MDNAGRRGSVDHPITVGLRMTHAGLGDKVTPERLYFSDLLVGQDVEERFQPRLQFAADAGTISALVELYGGPQSGMDRATVEFDVRGLDGATRAATRITPAKAEGEFRSVAIAQLPVARLSPGSYELHAKVLVDGRAVGSGAPPVDDHRRRDGPRAVATRYAGGVTRSTLVLVVLVRGGGLATAASAQSFRKNQPARVTVEARASAPIARVAQPWTWR